jgi:hypothetical protein
MKEDVSGDCRKLPNEKLNDLHSSTDIIRVIKKRNFRWGGGTFGTGGREAKLLRCFGGEILKEISCWKEHG